MKKIVLFSAVFILLTSCVSMSHLAQISGLSESELEAIPVGATDVILQKDVAASELYEEIYSLLLLRGYRIERDDKERYYIATEGNNLELLHRLTVMVTENTENKGKSTATIKAEWDYRLSPLVDENWVTAAWTGSAMEKSSNAFIMALAVARGVKGGKIIFK